MLWIAGAIDWYQKGCTPVVLSFSSYMSTRKYSRPIAYSYYPVTLQSASPENLFAPNDSPWSCVYLINLLLTQYNGYIVGYFVLFKNYKNVCDQSSTFRIGVKYIILFFFVYRFVGLFNFYVQINKRKSVRQWDWYWLGSSMFIILTII